MGHLQHPLQKNNVHSTKNHTDNNLIKIMINVLPNQTWVHLPTRSKANLLTPGCGEGKCSVYCRAPSKEYRQLEALPQKALPDGFQGKVFKDSEGGGLWGV